MEPVEEQAEDVIVEPSPEIDGGHEWRDTASPRPLFRLAMLGVALMLVWRYTFVWLDAAPTADGEWWPIVLGGALPLVFTIVYPVWAIRSRGGRVFGGTLPAGRIALEGIIAAGVWFLIVICNIISALLYRVVNATDPRMPQQMEEVAFSGDPLKLVFLAVLACLWAPICEEIFFRRFVLRALGERMALGWAVIVQALLFAVMHDYGGFHLTGIALLGLALGGLYVWRKTILAPMIMHLIQNGLVTLVLGVMLFFTQRAGVLGILGERVDAGHRVTDVAPGSGAAEAGLQAGDVIEAIDGQAVHDAAEIKMVLMIREPGETVELDVLRNGDSMQLDVMLSSREELERAASEKAAPDQTAPGSPAGQGSAAGNGTAAETQP